MMSATRGPAVKGARQLLLAMLALAAFLLSTSRSEATPLGPLRQPLRAFATDLKKWIDEQGETSISVVIDRVQTLPDFPANPSPGLAHLLTRELEMVKVPVKRPAKLTIRPKLLRVQEKGSCEQITKATINLAVLDDSGNMVHREDLDVTDRETLAVLIPCPPPEIKGNRIGSGPYGVEVLVNGKPRKPIDREGMPFVELDQGEVYSLRLINGSESEAAVWVGIDGLSMFTFNEDPEPDGKWRDYSVLLPARNQGTDGTFEVRGWYFHKGEGGSRKFMVTDYPASAASLKGVSAELGVISVLFRAAWPRGSTPRGGRATGFGPAFTQNFQTEKRETSDLKTTITIRYIKE